MAVIIQNAQGGIYHLDLVKKDLSHTILTVGDPQRVSLVSQYFDIIDFKHTSREFTTHTGFYKGKKLSVISTGMGVSCIEIFINEIDAIFNYDFDNNKAKEALTSLQIIRLGTSGAVHSDINIDDIVINNFAIGFDNINEFYPNKIHQWNVPHPFTITPKYIAMADDSLLQKFSTIGKIGCTLTMPGFYAPQARSIRLPNIPLIDFSKDYYLEDFSQKVYNIEMETAALYYFSSLLGHQCVSINAILAHRQKNIYSKQAKQSIENMILKVLDKLVNL